MHSPSSMEVPIFIQYHLAIEYLLLSPTTNKIDLPFELWFHPSNDHEMTPCHKLIIKSIFESIFHTIW